MKRNERGIALITALFALLLLTGIGLGLLYMTDAETMINANYRSSQQAYFAALAGAQSVRERMTPANIAPHLISPLTLGTPLTTPGNANSIMYVVANGVTPTAGGTDPDQQIAAEYQNITGGSPNCCFMAANTPDDTPVIIGNNNYVSPWRWVRIEQKVNGSNAPYANQGNNNPGGNGRTPICWNGADEVPLTAYPGHPNCSQGPGSDPPGHTPVYVLTSFANVNGSSRYLQMEVAQDPPIETHGAIDSANHITLNGKLGVDGYDYCTCKCSMSNGVSVCTNNALGMGNGGLAPTCDPSHYAIYTANTVTQNGSSETLTAGTNPVEATNQPWTWDTQQLYNKYANAPGSVNVTGPPYNWSCTGGSCGTQSNVTLGVPPQFPPTPAANPQTNPVNANMTLQTTVVPGDLQLTSNGSVGSGILVVNGNLDIHGGLSFYGLIIVTGSVTFTGGGSTGTNIYGAIIAGQQSVADLDTFGGSVNIQFDYCALPGGSQTQPPRSLALRDINF